MAYMEVEYTAEGIAKLDLPDHVTEEEEITSFITTQIGEQVGSASLSWKIVTDERESAGV